MSAIGQEPTERTPRSFDLDPTGQYLFAAGESSGKLAAYLMDKYGIVVIGVTHKDFRGIRVTPNIYATLDEIDTFGEAMQRAVAKGIS